MRPLPLLLLAACSGGKLTLDDSSAPVDDSAPSCDAVGALTLPESTLEAFYWGGNEPPRWSLPPTVTQAPCVGFVAESSAAWLVPALPAEASSFALTVNADALVSGRHDATVTVRDQDSAAPLATVAVHLDVLVQPAEGERKVLVVGVDGLDGEALQSAYTPTLNRLAEGGAWTREATTQLTGDTNSGPGWTSVLTGVEVSRHGITANGDYDDRNTAYPSFLYRVKDALGLSTAASIQWTPIYEILEDDAVDQAWSGSEAEVTAQMAGGLRSGLYDVHFVHFDDVDAAGHASGYTAASDTYLTAVEQADADIGVLLGAILDRPTIAAEDWLILVTSDHGGTEGGTHGCRSDDCRTIPFYAAGPSVPNEQLDVASHLDIHPTVLEFLGLDPGDYTLDGVAVGGLRERECENGVDDDGDGRTDCDDPDCAQDEACWTCDPEDLGSDIGAAVVSSITPAVNQLAGSCGGDDGGESVFLWTAPEAGWYAFDTMDCYRDTVLYLLDGGCEGPEIACNDQPSSTVRSVVAAELDVGQRLAVVVDTDGVDGNAACLAIYPYSDSCPDDSLGSGETSRTDAWTHRDVVYAGTCPPAVSVAWFSWTAPEAGTWTFDTYGSDYDTVLYVLDGCDGVELGCNDDATDYQSELSLTLSAGQDVVVGVGSFAGRSSSGTRVINVSR
ncbi:MAG: alkaline phosphatase [Alphaproteobacteria bacterium]|nr:alkaline phosphatase [Alphaproteobacteria bacterium]